MSGPAVAPPARMNPQARVPVLRVVETHAEGLYPRASMLLRAMARTLDLAIAWGLHVAGAEAGDVFAVLYLLLADGILQGGQSVGKRLCGIRVLHVPTRAGARYRESVLRNAPLGFIVLLSMMPAPLGGLAFLGGALLIGGLEAARAVRDEHGQRLGDLWAETQVVDGKVVAGSALPGRAGAGAQAPGSFLIAARDPRAQLRVGRSGTCGSR